MKLIEFVELIELIGWIELNEQKMQIISAQASQPICLFNSINLSTKVTI